MYDVEDVLNELLAVGAVPSGRFIGCTVAEIDHLMKDQGVSALPSSYRRFLERAGRDAGPIFVGSEISYPGLLGIKRASENLLTENFADWALKQSDFVIQMHQGYQIFWIDTAVAEPEVWMYTEGDTGPTAFLVEFIDYLKAASPLERHCREIRSL